MSEPPRDNVKGGAWLLADMALNIWALSIVKALGLGYPPAQIVFLRALVGFVLILPWVIRQRQAFRALPDLHIHALRVALSTITLAASFFAIARVPLALFTAVNFTRPLISMVMAALILHEVIGPRRWLAAGIALVGVVIAVEPGAVALSSGLLALCVVVLTGSGAVIATRRLRAAPPVVMMAFYTAGLALCSLPFAAWSWTPIPGGELLALLAIGAFAQAAQFCFISAHYHGEAGVLSVLGYLSLPISVSMGYLAFGEVPTPRFWAGASLVIAAAVWVSWRMRAR